LKAPVLSSYQISAEKPSAAQVSLKRLMT